MFWVWDGIMESEPGLRHTCDQLQSSRGDKEYSTPLTLCIALHSVWTHMNGFYLGFKLEAGLHSHKNAKHLIWQVYFPRWTAWTQMESTRDSWLWLKPEIWATFCVSFPITVPFLCKRSLQLIFFLSFLNNWCFRNLHRLMQVQECCIMLLR